MKSILTQKQKEKYLRLPLNCPFCNSENVRWGMLDSVDLSGYRDCECKDCEKEWTEIYELTKVLGEDE